MASTSPSFLITGTDTGVGKTTVSCFLISTWRSRGLRVGVMKPAETGCPPTSDGKLEPQDAALLKAYSGCEAPLDAICPFRFAEPLAPLLAARRENRPIDIATIATRYRDLTARHDVVLVEGAGGLLVPLTAEATFADLALQLGLTLIVVVGSKLGCINHCLLTIRHAQAIGLPVAGYILNELTDDPDLAQRTNGELLTELVGPPLAVVPYVKDWQRQPISLEIDLPA